MTIEATGNRVSLTGNGATVDIAFPYALFADTDLVVIETIIATGVQTTKTLTTQYTFSGTPDAAGHYPDGGTVTAVTAPASTVTWTVYRDPPAIQSLDLVENDDAPAEAQEAQFDYLTMLIQRVKEQVTRGLSQPEGDSATIDRLPAKVDRAGMFLAFDADGDPVASAGTSADLGPVSAFINTLLDDATDAIARATLGVPTLAEAGVQADNVFRVTGSADVTKKLAFEVDGLTAGQTRTATVPDRSGTLAFDTTVASYASTDSLASGVGLAVLSGASFVFSLPAAALHTNREVTILHRGTSLTQIYTVTANGAENIVGQDASATTFILYTAGEKLRLKSNGTGWDVIAHDAKTDWADAGAMTITATTSNPTKPTTPDIDKVYWRRDGNRVFLRYILQVSSASGSAAGTGSYLFALPTNIAFDTTILTPVATALTVAVRSEASASFLPSSAIANVDSTSFSPLSLFAYDTTHFQAWRSDLADSVGAAAAALTNAELSYNFDLHARAANWRL